MLPPILLYVIFTIIRPQDYLPAFAHLPVMPVTLIVAFGLWLASSNRTRGTPQFLLLPAFLLAIMASKTVSGWAGGAVLQAEIFGPTVVTFLVLATGVSGSRQRVRVAMTVLTLCAFVLALHGVDQAMTGVGWTGAPLKAGRIQYVGIFHDPNDLGMLFVTVLPMAIYLSTGGGIVRRLFWLAGAALLLYGIHLTKSRGTLLALVAVVGVYLWRRRGLLTAGGITLVGFVLLRVYSPRLQNLSPDESSAAGRIDAWYAGLQMFQQHPLFGVGPGNFIDFHSRTAHNSLVLVLAETGLIGFTLWLAFVGYSFWMMLTMLQTAAPVTARSTGDVAAEPAFMAHAGSVHKDAEPDSRIAMSPDGLDAAQTEPAMASLMHARGAIDQPSRTAGDADWDAERALGLTLLLSLSGMFAAAFFLSRSYTVIIYIVIAIVAGEYMGARQRFPDLREFSLGEGWWRLVPAAVGAIVILFVVVKLLLAMQ